MRVKWFKIEQIIRPRVVAGLQGKNVFQTQLNSCTYEISETVGYGTGPEPCKPR